MKVRTFITCNHKIQQLMDIKLLLHSIAVYLLLHLDRNFAINFELS